MCNHVYMHDDWWPINGCHFSSVGAESFHLPKFWKDMEKVIWEEMKKVIYGTHFGSYLGEETFPRSIVSTIRRSFLRWFRKTHSRSRGKPRNMSYEGLKVSVGKSVKNTNMIIKSTKIHPFSLLKSVSDSVFHAEFEKHGPEAITLQKKWVLIVSSEKNGLDEKLKIEKPSPNQLFAVKLRN